MSPLVQMGGTSIDTFLATFAGAFAGGVVVLVSETLFRRAEAKRSTWLTLLLSIQDDIDTLERMILSKNRDSLARARRIDRNSRLLGLCGISDEAKGIAQKIQEGDAHDAGKLGELLNGELEQFLPSLSR